MRHVFRATLLSLVLAVPALARPALAEAVPADCAALTQGLRTVPGYTLTAPPAGPEGGWCVLDGAVLRSDALENPDVSAERLRLRGTVADGVPVMLEVDMAGLRIRPKAGDRTLDDRVRGLLRLQSADLRLLAVADPATGSMRIETLEVQLSGGTEVQLSAEVAGAGLATLATGRLVALDLSLRSDGRLLRPLMALAGESSAPDLTESQAVDAARDALRRGLVALPEAMFRDESRSALERAVTALPQGRGRLTLSLRSDDGIGAARLMMAGLTGDPLAPEALAQLLQGAQVTADWTPGLAP